MVNISNIVKRVINKKVKNILISSYILRNIIEMRTKAQIIISAIQRGIIYLIK